MIALFSWETDWPELRRAPILYYYISELDCDYYCSWTCIFSSLHDLVEVEITEMGEIWVWMWGRRKALQSQDCRIIWQGMRVRDREDGGRKGQEPSCLCSRSASLYCSVSQWPQLSWGKPLLSQQLAVSLIFQQWLYFKQPCWTTGMNFSPGRGHKCLPSCWNTGSPTHSYSRHRLIHTATSRNQAVF